MAEGIDRMTPILTGEVVDLPDTTNTSSDFIGPLFFIFAIFGWGFLSILSSTKSWWLGGVVGGILGLIFIGIYGAILIGLG